MFSVLHQCQILNAVVVGVTIDVVDDLALTQRSANMLRHDQPVLQNAAISPCVGMVRHVDFGISMPIIKTTFAAFLATTQYLGFAFVPDPAESFQIVMDFPLRHLEDFGDLPSGLAFFEVQITEKIPIERIEELVREVFDLRPAAIIRDLKLLAPIYRPTAAYGHFGRNEAGFSWERTDKADILKREAGL